MLSDTPADNMAKHGIQFIKISTSVDFSKACKSTGTFATPHKPVHRVLLEHYKFWDYHINRYPTKACLARPIRRFLVGPKHVW